VNLDSYTQEVIAIADEAAFEKLSAETEALDEKLARDFLGGYGLGAKILFDRQKPGVDPLGPESILGITTGVLAQHSDYAAMGAVGGGLVGYFGKDKFRPGRTKTMQGLRRNIQSGNRVFRYDAHLSKHAVF